MKTEYREAVHNELHGVESRYDASKHENPENHYRALIQFENELNNPNSGISSEQNSSYLRALSLNSSYILSSSFRLRFLRAEFFDISKAVVRFCSCLNLLVELFGEVSLLRQIFLSDLTKSERKLLKEGTMQLSPSRDSLGRRTLFFLGNVGENYHPRERDRVGIYLIFQVAAEDETTQRNGLVTIHIMSEGVHRSMTGENLPKLCKFFGSVFNSCPLRFSAIHMCFPNKLLYQLLKPVMLMTVGNTGRKFLKIHSGTTIECNYSLNSFGVRQDDIPTTYSGTIKTRQHIRWLKVRDAMDEYVEQQCKEYANRDYRLFYASDQYTINSFPHIQCPGINCVLFHKNGVAWEFPGNVKFREFLDERLSYNNHLNNKGCFDVSVAPSEREGFLDRIIRLSLERNFQFLLHDDTKHWYDELKNPAILRRYIGFAIRGRQRRVGAKRQRKAWSSNDVDNNTVGRNQGTRSAVFTNMDGGEAPNFGSN